MSQFNTDNKENSIYEEHKTVRLTLISKHIMPDLSRMNGARSLFNNVKGMKAKDKPVTPENYPEEMNEAVRVIMDNDAGAESRFGFDDDYDDLLPEEQDEQGDALKMIEELAKYIEEQDVNENEDDGSFVFKTLASMTRREAPDGSEEIEIAYDEHDSLDKTRTVILYNTSRPGVVSIFHEGDVTSIIVCEKGVRHFSVYNTPIMPFELAVYGRKCTGAITYSEGGELEIDYIIEIRGADVQRTIMKIYVDIL